MILDLFKLVGSIAIKDEEAKKALDDVSKEGEKTESKLSKAFSAMGKGAAVAGKAIMTGLAAGGAAMAGLTVKALQLGGDLEQNMGGAEAVFGELGKTIGDMKTPMQVFNAATGEVETQMSSLETVSKQAFQNMGLSQSDYLATANKMGALFKGAGFETQEALDLSSSAMQRAADVASIMGLDTEAAMEAVAGAAKGNFTMMDNLGVAMNDTAIQNYALEKGINKTTAEMTQQEKIGLAMEMFMEKTAYAAGNYAKENATLAGSLGTAKAALTNFLAGSGDVESLVSSFSNLANVVVNSLKEIAPRLTQGLSDLVSQVAPLIAPLLNQLLPVLVDGAVTLIDGLVAAMPGIVSAIMGVLPSLIEGVMQLINALVVALPQIFQSIIEALPTIIETIVAALPTLIPNLITGIVQMITTLCTMLPQIIQPIIDYLPDIIISIVEALVQNLPVLIEGLISLITALIPMIPQIIQALVDALPMIISLLVTALLENLPAIIAGLVQVVVGIVAALPQIFGALNEAIPAALAGIWDGIANVFGGLGDWFGEKFGAAKDAAVNAWNGAKEKWNEIKEKCVEGFNNFKDKVSTKFSEAKEAAQQKWADAKEKWNGVKDKVVEGFSNLKDKIGTKFNEAKTKAQEKWNDAKSKFSSVKDKVVSAFSDLGSKVSPLFSKAKTNATNTWNNVKSIFNKFKNGDIVGAFSDLGSLLKGKFSGALNLAKKGFDKIKDIGKDLVKGLWNGINNAKDWVLGKIKGFGESVLNGLKSFFGIKSPSTVMRDEVGKWLAEGVAEGIDLNSKKAESAAEKMGNAILQAAQQKLDNYKVYNDMAVEDEVAFWDEIRKTVAEGTQARIEADKKYFDALSAAAAEHEKAASAILQEAESRLNNFKVYNEMSLEDEVTFWDELRKTIDEGTQARIDADKKYFEAEKKALKDKLTGFETELKNRKIYNKVTIAEEAKFWDESRKQFAEGTEERIAADEKYFAAKEQIDNEILDSASARLEDYKMYNDMTLYEEMAFWDEVRLQIEEGTDARLEADKKYLSAKKSIDEKRLAAEEKLQSDLDAIAQKEEERTKSILGNFSLFETVADSEYISEVDMMKGINSQVNALEEWESTLKKLETRIGGTALYEELESMGVDSLAQLKTINSMSEDDLNYYISMYDKRNSIAGRFAKDLTADETITETQKAYQTFADTCEELGVSVPEDIAAMAGKVSGSFGTIAGAIGSVISLLGGNGNYTGLFSLNNVLGNAEGLKIGTTLGTVGTIAHTYDVAPLTTTEKPENKLISEMSTVITDLKDEVKNIKTMLVDYFPQLIDAFDVTLVTDTGVLVAEMAEPMNEALGIISTRKDRGQ